ncbi:hypothetical protein L226DRAFT_108017 [Lentinus tigrinus ALCF2SS1-7]|uniref:uncharacterized protein n=1 Tax=Lentinus tigrinus ALCF2SS1-7 TaxID=1328758 RepID=UPI001165DE21|nr:hypothetical protein L226DRAFT_108017 [Lentinus tigrinus ALCF2SS1-7]
MAQRLGKVDRPRGRRGTNRAKRGTGRCWSGGTCHRSAAAYLTAPVLLTGSRACCSVTGGRRRRCRCHGRGRRTRQSGACDVWRG